MRLFRNNKILGGPAYHVQKHIWIYFIKHPISGQIQLSRHKFWISKAIKTPLECSKNFLKRIFEMSECLQSWNSCNLKIVFSYPFTTVCKVRLWKSRKYSAMEWTGFIFWGRDCNCMQQVLKKLIHNAWLIQFPNSDLVR